MRVLVTGATGFIGSWAVRALLDRDHEVIGTFRPGRVPPPDLTGHARFVGWPAELDDPVAVETLAREAHAEVTVHMAWYAEPATYLRSPRNMDSLATTVRLARALHDSGCRRIVAAGTCVEYAPKNRPQVESDPTEARTLYAACKHAARMAMQALADEVKTQFAWARIFHLHGPGDHPARLLPSIVHQLRRGLAVELTDGTQVRDHLHVADVGTAIASIATSDATGIFNVCSGEPVTLRQVVEAVAGEVGRPDLLRFGARPHRPQELMFLVGDPTRLKGLGWAPRFTLIDGLRDAIATV